MLNNGASINGTLAEQLSILEKIDSVSRLDVSVQPSIHIHTNEDLIQYNLRLIASLAHCNADWQRLDDWYQVKKNQHNKINAKDEIKEVLNE